MTDRLFRPAKLSAVAGLLAALTATAAPAQDCSRDCLSGYATAYLQSLVSGDTRALPMTDDVRVTQDAVEIAPGEGFWTQADGLRQHRLNVLDEDWQTAAGLAVMEQDGQAALLAYRLKVENGRVSEIEQFVVSPPEEGEEPGLLSGGGDRETLAVPRPELLRPVDPMEQNSRTELLLIAQSYPDGLKAGSFQEVDAPIADTANRMENGMVLAGPRCTFNDNCKNMKAQPSPARPTLRQRVLAVDEPQGVVFMWLDWEQQSGQTLQVYEAFKIYGGHIQAVEAFIEHGDPDLYPGWPMDQ